MLKLRVSTAQHIGTREEQQDVILATPIEGGHLLLLADGMGGHTNGRAAAQIACRTFPAAFGDARLRHPKREDQFTQAFREAHYAVVREARSGGCALTVAYIRLDEDPAVWFAHSGDVLGELISPSGEILHATEPHRHGRHTLAQCLGVREFTEPTCSDGFRVPAGSSVVLASDGAFEELPTPLLPDVRDPAWAKISVARAVHHAPGEERDNASILFAFTFAPITAPRRRKP